MVFPLIRAWHADLGMIFGGYAWNGGRCIETPHDYIDVSSFEWMPCIGLQDSNNNPIYLNDIVEINYIRYRVIFDPPAYKLKNLKDGSISEITTSAKVAIVGTIYDD